MKAPEADAAAGKGFAFQPAWSQKLGAAPGGLALARERDWVLAWDVNSWLHLFDHAGNRQGQTRLSEPPVSAGFSDDGTAIVAAGNQGEVSWLAPDLMPRWRHSLAHPALAVAVDPFGQYLAVSDRAGNLSLFNRPGKIIAQLQTPRPLHHLAFVPSAAALVGCADLGLVICLDLAGKVRWRDGLFANAGALTVNGDGSKLLVSCFSEGLQIYDLEGQKKERLAVPEPCRLAALAFTGLFILTAGINSQRLFLLDPTGQVLASQRLNQEVVSLALGPLGDGAVLALADGSLQQLKIIKAQT